MTSNHLSGFIWSKTSTCLYHCGLIVSQMSVCLYRLHTLCTQDHITENNLANYKNKPRLAVKNTV